MFLNLIKYPFFSITSLVVTLASYFFAPIIALFVDSKGDLPKLLKWFQTSDNPCWGDPGWKQNNPSYSTYKLIITWLWRNPAQGFDQVVSAKVTMNTPVKVYGNLNISDGVHGTGGYYLIVGGGYFHFATVIPLKFTGKCLTQGFGWRLNNIAKGYPHPTMGQLVFTPGRFYAFS